MYEALAMRIYLMGKQNGPKEVRRNKNALESDIREAVKYFNTVCRDADGNPYAITEPDLLRRCISALYFEVGTRDEIDLCRYFRALLSSAGQFGACDEKVFQHDTASSGMIRVVPAKKQVGLWNYTVCLRLSGGLQGANYYPFLVYTRCHTENTNLDEHVTTAAIIRAQVKFLRLLQPNRRFSTILVWDSYYGTLASLQYLREQRIPSIWCLNVQRFASYRALLDRFVQKTSDMAFAERAKDEARDLDELITVFWSPDHRKAKRWTWTNALHRENEAKKGGYIPGFDHYEHAFNICDVFNRELHDKSWPYRYSGKSQSSEIQAGSDFLITIATVNMWNYWRSLDVPQQHVLSYERFCTQLATLVMCEEFEPDDPLEITELSDDESD